MDSALKFVSYAAGILLFDFMAFSYGYIFHRDVTRPESELHEIRRKVRYNPLKPLRVALVVMAAALLVFFPKTRADTDFGLLGAIPLLVILIGSTCWEFWTRWRQAGEAIGPSGNAWTRR